MRTPTTVGGPGSAVRGFGVAWGLAAALRRTGLRPVALPVALVPLTTLDLSFGFLSTVSRERLADIIGFLKLSGSPPADESLVTTGIDQFRRGFFPPSRVLHGRFLVIALLVAQRINRAIWVPVDELEAP